LQDAYWQRASYDAVAVVAAVLGLIAVAPHVRHWKPRQWLVFAGIADVVAIFAALLIESMHAASRRAALQHSHTQRPVE
jgi:hypothetical protein